MKQQSLLLLLSLIAIAGISAAAAASGHYCFFVAAVIVVSNFEINIVIFQNQAKVTHHPQPYFSPLLLIYTQSIIFLLAS